MDVIKDSSLKHKRVVIQLKPLDNTEIINQQKNIESVIPGFQNYAPEVIHFTLFHFGKPQDLHKEIVKYSGNNLSYEDFYSKFITLLSSLVFINEFDYVSLDCSKVTVFGYPSAVERKLAVVLLLENTYKLYCIREKFILVINDWLISLGIEDYAKFYQSSNNFKHNHPDNYAPHVTIGRVCSNNLPTNYVVEIPPISLKLGKASFLNVIET